jgi:selenocysteine-specific elongation factor
MIIGTAGHIDHGKTTLVRALTGVDTDRLKEEKARGLSIELGFAYTSLEGERVLGFIDVPGHERLVHTMVAGACGIDFALLVVAADDGVMPQTREHLAILELLGVQRGAVALTKIDRVPDERVAQVAKDVRAELAPTSLRDAPTFLIDATAAADAGIASLKDHLRRAAVSTPPHSDDALFRLAVDRVFTLPGHGMIVAGTVFSGQVRVGDTIVAMPAGEPLRVRSIHAQNRAADRGRAGERCALNIVGVGKHGISRGDWLADPEVFAPSSRIDARLRLLERSDACLQAWSPVHVHLGTAHQIAHVVPLESSRLLPGEVACVQLVCATPLCALPGDRFIVRDPQAAHTIGGGQILDPFAPSRRRRSAGRRRYLAAIEQMLSGGGVEPLLREAPQGVTMTDLTRLTGQATDRIALPSAAVAISAGRERYVLLDAHWRALREHALAALRDFHAQAPDEPGPDVGRLRRIALPSLSQGLWQALITELVCERRIIRTGPWLRLPEHTVVLSESDLELAQQLQCLIGTRRLDPPWVRELAAAVHQPEERVRQLLRKQVRQGALYQVVKDLFYVTDGIDELARVIAALAREHGAVSAACYRDAIGLGRKRAIQILEFFDRVGYTRRVHDTHVLRTGSGWR